MQTADYSKLTPMSKLLTLNGAVLNGTPDDVRRVFSEYGNIDITGIALVNAYRYRGFEMVKTLVECGAEFETNCFPNGAFPALIISVGVEPFFPLVMLNVNEIKGCYVNAFLEGDRILKYYDNIGDDVPLSPVLTYSPNSKTDREEREKMFDYLYDNRERAKIDFGELLYYAYFARDQVTIERLKKRGVTFSEMRRRIITGKFGRHIPVEWSRYVNLVRCLSDKNFLPVMKNIASEAGDKLHLSQMMYEDNIKRIFSPDILAFVLDNFNNAKMNKSAMMKQAIDTDKPDCLELMVNRGWLKLPKKRDEMIQYAVDNSKTECTAYLLEYKNRTADIAAERLKADKKQERELNADPNSVTELKKIWGFKKREDGTLIITRYKGNRTEIAVPNNIGCNVVSAIGKEAFSPNGSRLTDEQRKFRRAITKITLPDSINEIGEGAFSDCRSLKVINIPDGVKRIESWAFGYCGKLDTVKLPNSLTVIGNCGFHGCKSLVSINVPYGVTEIGNNAFSICESLEDINIPDSVTEIGENAFNSCTALKSINIPNGVTKIGCGTFYLCTSLVSVNIPESMIKIENSAFYNCTALVSLKIPEGVTEIGKLAFTYCSALEAIELPESLSSVQNGRIDGETRSVFYGNTKITAVVVPKSYAERYCKHYGVPYTYKGGSSPDE